MMQILLNVQQQLQTVTEMTVDSFNQGRRLLNHKKIGGGGTSRLLPLRNERQPQPAAGGAAGAAAAAGGAGAYGALPPAHVYFPPTVAAANRVGGRDGACRWLWKRRPLPLVPHATNHLCFQGSYAACPPADLQMSGAQLDALAAFYGENFAGNGE
jgi:hypothetical protein